MYKENNKFLISSIVSIAIIIVIAVLAGLATRDTKNQAASLSSSEKIAELEAKLKEFKDQEEAQERFGQYVINQMYTAGAQKSLSAGKMQVLARAIVRIAFDIYQSEESRKAFVMVIAIESGFNRFAQSPTGPKGYGQLAKNTFKEALADCGVKDLHDEDVWEQDLNLYAAACYYKKLVDARGGDTYAAAIAYNQGPNSESDKTYRKSGRLEAIEPMKYLAKFSFLDRQVTPEKPSGVPSIADLPTPKVTERN